MQTIGHWQRLHIMFSYFVQKSSLQYHSILIDFAIWCAQIFFCKSHLPVLLCTSNCLKKRAPCLIFQEFSYHTKQSQLLILRKPGEEQALALKSMLWMLQKDEEMPFLPLGKTRGEKCIYNENLSRVSKTDKVEQRGMCINHYPLYRYISWK